jgi:glycerol-3-phosphate responsive antiterminator
MQSILSMVFFIRIKHVNSYMLQKAVNLTYHTIKYIFGQVMALTTHIEAHFQRQLKTCTLSVDLTLAYDTVCRERLMMKFMNAVFY